MFVALALLAVLPSAVFAQPGCSFADETPAFIFPPPDYIFDEPPPAGLKVNFSWTFASLATGADCVCYHFQVKFYKEGSTSLLETPTVPCNFNFTSTTMFYSGHTLPLTQSGKYFWQIESCNQFQLSSTIKVCSLLPRTALSFCLRSRPTAPAALVLPAQNSNQPPNPTFSWTVPNWGKSCSADANGGNRITIFLSEPGGGFMKPWQHLRGDVTSFTPELDDFLAPGTYEWKVSITNGYTPGILSSVRNFTVCSAGTPPDMPSINTYPARFDTSLPMFSWNESNWGDDCGIAGGRLYSVFIDKSLSPSTAVSTDQSESTWQATTAFQSGLVYRMRVSATNGLNWENSSTVNEFSVCENSAPTEPVAVYPIQYVQGDGLASVPVTFVWQSPDSWGSNCEQSAVSTLAYFFSYEGSAPVMVVDNFYTHDVVGMSAHTWTVTASNGAMNKSKLFSFQFCTPIAPDAPSQLAEDAGTLSWTCTSVGTSCGAGDPMFKLTLSSTAPDHQHVVFMRASSSQQSYVYTPVPPLQPGIYQWEVAVNNGNDDVWKSTTHTVCVRDIAAPELLTPEDGSFEDFGTVNFTMNFPRLLSCGATINAVLRSGIRMNWTDDVLFFENVTQVGTYSFFNASYALGSYSWEVELVDADTDVVYATSPVLWFVRGTCEIVPPSLASPIQPPDGGIGSGVLQWTDEGLGVPCSTGSKGKYTVVIQDVGNGSKITVESSVPTATVNQTLLSPGTTYSWTVTASNGDDATKVVSGPWTFSMCSHTALPSVPDTVYPENIQVAVPVTLTWSAITFLGCGPRTVEVHLGNSIIGYADETATSFAIRTSVLSTDGSYSWSLHIRDGDSTKVAGPYQFQACQAPAPEVPTVDTLLPVDGSFVSASTTSFSWGNAAFGNVGCGTQNDQYFLQLGTEDQLPNLPRVASVSDSVTSYAMSTLLSITTSGMYYWNIRTSNGPAQSSTSSATLSVWICKEEAPAAFSLLEPAAGSKPGSPFQFKWEETSFGEDCRGLPVNYTVYIGVSTDKPTMTKVLELPGYKTSAVYTPAGNGVKYWYVKKTSYVTSVDSEVFNFTVCNPAEVQGVPTPTPALMNANLASPFTLTWSAPPDWGSTCSGKRKYHVFLAKSGTVPEYFNSSDSESLFVPFDPHAITLTPGLYDWQVQADNGYFMSNLSAISTFSLCVPTPPTQPVLISPDNGADHLPSNLTFQIAPNVYWGELCGKADGGEYQLLMGIGFADSVYMTLPSTTTITNVGTGTIDFQGENITMVTWTWTATLKNALNISSTTPSRVATVCTESEPEKPTPSFPPFNSTNITTYMLTFEWAAMDSINDFGKVCDAFQTVAEIQLFLSPANVTDDIMDFPMIYHGIPSKPNFQMSEDDKLNVSTTYLWYLVAWNGFDKTYSPVMNFTTRLADCSMVYCVPGKGQCDDVTVQCTCNEGWTGKDCSVSTDKSLSPGIIGAIVGGGVALLLGIALAISIILGIKLRRKRRFTIKPPEFNVMMFSEVHEPIINPGEPEPPVQLLEQVLFQSKDSARIVWELCKLTAVTEADTLCKALVYAFERQGKGLQLIMQLISQEVEEAANVETLFRANSHATKAFKYYSKMIGLPYIFNTLAVLLQAMIRELEDAEEEKKTKEEEATKETASVKLFSAQYEVDPDRIDDLGDTSINVLTLEFSCQKFIVQITRSASRCPAEFKQLCAHIKKVIGDKFPDYVFKAIGAFIFLRFYNTAITVPESYGLMPVAPSAPARRQLILLSKVLQNLANSVKFGDKEEFMKRLNRFIDSNQDGLFKFYDKICDASAKISNPVAIPDVLYSASIGTIFQQLRVIHQTAGLEKLVSAGMPEELAAVVSSGGKKKKKRKHDGAGGEGDEPLVMAGTSSSAVAETPEGQVVPEGAATL